MENKIIDEKALYDVFCKKTYVPIYSKPWWMDAVCLPQNWNVHVIANSGQYIAAMPYYLIERNGYRLITKPHLTQTNGIIINYPPKQKYCSRLDMEENVINEMCHCIEGLNLDKYEQQFTPMFTNWLPFKWNGYQDTVRYTYVIDDTSDIEKIQAGYSFKLRNKIKNAEKQLHLIEYIDVEQFYQIIKRGCERDGEDISYSLDLLKRIDSACKERNCRKILAAEDERGAVHGAVYLIWDEKYVYYLIGGAEPELRSSQSISYLINQSIMFAGELGKAFDFEGSVLQPVERAFRGFGAEQHAYFRISKVFNQNLDESKVNHWSDEELNM